MISDSVKTLKIPEGVVNSIAIGNSTMWTRPHIYGVSWSGGTSATMTRTDDSKNFVSPVIGNGAITGFSSFDSCYPWKDIKTITDNGNVLVSIPKFWYKWTSNGSTLSLQICDKPISGFYVSPMHADRGDGKGERDVAYIGKYKCASDYKSKAGQAPKVSITIGSARTGIKALGAGYYQQDYASFWTLRMLFLVEWATWDSQSVLKNTTDFESGSVVTGKTASMSYHTGISADGYSVQYRHVEDPWENCLEWLDGLYYSGTDMYVINNPNNFTVGSNGIKVGTRPTSYGYIKSWTIPTVSGYEWALIPTGIADAESYTYDGYYYASSGTVTYIGGARSTYAVHGAFFLYTDFTASGTSSAIGARLIKLP